MKVFWVFWTEMNVIENMYIASLYMLISHGNHGMVPPNQNLFLMRLITHLPHCRWFCRIQSFPCYQTLRRCTFHIRKYRVPKGNWQSKIGNFLCSTCSLRSVKKKMPSKLSFGNHVLFYLKSHFSRLQFFQKRSKNLCL